MKKISKSLAIFIGLVVALALSNLVQVLLPSYQEMLIAAGSPVPLWAVALVNVMSALIIYGGLGFLGFWLTGKLGWASIWDPMISNRRRFLQPAIIGVCLGIFLILGDEAFAPFNGIGHFMHPSFPSSIFASLSAGIGEEIIFRLFFICFWVWIVSKLIMKDRRQNLVFWIVSLVSAVVFAFGHLPTLMNLYHTQSLSTFPPLLYVEVLLLNGLVSIFAAYNMRKYGFLAAVGIHFWTDMVWHVAWGLTQVTY